MYETHSYKSTICRAKHFFMYVCSLKLNELITNTKSNEKALDVIVYIMFMRVL